MKEMYEKLLQKMGTLDDGPPRNCNLDFDEYPEDPEFKSLQIHQALLFWRSLNELIKNHSTENRQSLLTRFANHPNQFVGVVAMLEALPVKIWRRVLWRANINFESFPSFLRRLTKENYTAIRNNYEDIIQDKPARILNWWERRFKKFTVSEKINDSEKRYQGKGSWSFNLLGLDFGFNSFRNGLDDDFRAEVKSWRDFWSIENHSDDFIVNQEFGKYWWLYRTARSNYGWMRNRIVNLNDHICPGFYWTFIVHLVLWVLSPIVALNFGWIPYYFESWWNLIWITPFALLGIITPLWLISAIIWSSYRALLASTHREKIFKGFVIFDDWVGEYIGSPVLIFLGCMSICAGVGAIAFVTWLGWDFFTKTMGYLGGTLIIILFWYYIVETIIIGFNKGRWPRMHERLAISPYIYLLAYVRIVGEFFLVYGYLVAELINYIWAGFRLLGLMGTMVMLLMLLPMILVALSYFIKDDRLYERISNLFCSLMFGFIVLSFVCIPFVIYEIAQMLIVTGLEYFVSIIVLTLIGALYIGVIFYITYLMFIHDPEVSNYRSWILKTGIGESKIFRYFNYPTLKWMMKKNRYYKKLSPKERLVLLNKAYRVANRIFYDSFDLNLALKYLLPVVSDKLLDALHKENFNKCDLLFSIKEKLRIFKLVVDGMPIDLAISYIRQKAQETQKREERQIESLEKLLKPFIKIGEWLSQLKWIRDKFYEICPYIKITKQLEF
ncbi:hypothetical protein K8R32_01190 [bacterium]|nr:hypothetical protein [bacterium]